MSSDQRPGGPLGSTVTAPVFLIRHGSHCADLMSEVDTVTAVQSREVEVIKQWVREFYDNKAVAT